MLAVALIFFSCEDEGSILGFKNPNKRFKVNYVDIPLESSVFLMDSMRTTNSYLTDGETLRLLAGHYTDDQFGEVRATAFTQFFTTNTAKTLLKETAVLDSVSLQLRFDFYSYGGQEPTPQTISVHEIERELRYDSLGYYFNKSNTPYDPTALGSKTFSYDPELFEKYRDDGKDTTITIRMPLDLAFGQRIFASALKYRDANTQADSAFVREWDFVKEFHGIAIVPESADKVFGFDPEATASRITLHYHDAETDSLQLNLSFLGMVNYSEIDGDRANTALAELTQYSSPIVPDNGLRYVQAGTGVLTRLDFSRFYDFVDADSNAAVIVNSAELYLGAPVASSNFEPIRRLSLRAVTHAGYLKRVKNLADSISVGLYSGQLAVEAGIVTVAGIDRGLFTAFSSGDDDVYSGYLTLFAQQLFEQREGKQRFRYFALYPQDPPIGKSVHRVIFNEGNIKLRVYYTRPDYPIP